MDKTNALLQARFPGVRHVIFGHLGDGNLHYNVANAAGQTEAELLALQGEIYGVVHDSVHAHAGSISAEHGVGQLKRDELPRYKSAIELGLMRRIKRALDPQGLMNPARSCRTRAGRSEKYKPRPDVPAQLTRRTAWRQVPQRGRTIGC